MTEDAQAALSGRLRKKSHEELLFVVEQILERKPDIGPLVELLIENITPIVVIHVHKRGRVNAKTEVQPTAF